MTEMLGLFHKICEIHIWVDKRSYTDYDDDYDSDFCFRVTAADNSSAHFTNFSTLYHVEFQLTKKLKPKFSSSTQKSCTMKKPD